MGDPGAAGDRPADGADHVEEGADAPCARPGLQQQKMQMQQQKLAATSQLHQSALSMTARSEQMRLTREAQEKQMSLQSQYGFPQMGMGYPMYGQAPVMTQK